MSNLIPYPYPVIKNDKPWFGAKPKVIKVDGECKMYKTVEGITYEVVKIDGKWYLKK
jgi:hypothetical protein